MSWTAILLLAAGAYAAKVLGLVVIGPRVARRPGRWLELVALLPAAVLAALVVVQTFGGDRALIVGARAAGVGAATVVAWRRAPFPVIIVVGAAATAILRQLA